MYARANTYSLNNFVVLLMEERDGGKKTELYLLSTTFCIELNIKWLQKHHGSGKCHSRD